MSDLYWARTIGAARTRNIDGARNNVTKYRESIRALLAGRGPDARIPPTVRIAQLEAEGWIAFAEGRRDEALRTLWQAATLEAEEVGESVVVPARETLADLLIELGRPAAALREYESLLKAAPNRFNTLLGAARASMAVGDRSKARAYYQLLLAVAAPDADREELRDARAFVNGR